MTNFSDEEREAVQQMLAELREEQEEEGTLHMGFTIEDVKKRVPILTDKPEKYVLRLLEERENSGVRIKRDAIGGGSWKFL